ncbi:MAG: hypothetical protein ACW97Z_05135 [Candidatus Hodarchaeales archaeon]|jgi:hypothetical protein
MKEMNKDAKVLIRSYIDNIETYLKSICKMHPNEIDTLLTEINDFMYIRSDELATGETILHSDVLKAMEECGSPSDICEQYLESESEDTSPIEEIKSGINGKIAGKPSSPSPPKSESKSGLSRSISSENYLDQLRKSRFFAIYRFISAFTFLMLIIMVFVTPFGNWGRYIFYLYYVNYIIDNFLSIGALWIFGFLFTEGWLIHRWKGRLSTRGFLREYDDAVTILIARAGFLVLLLKATLLPISWRAFLIFPILVVLQLVLERQFKTHLWTKTLSPLLLTMAHSIDSGNTASDIRRTLQNWRISLQYYPVYEKVSLSFGVPFFLLSLLFPWLYGWNGDIFNTEHLIGPLNVHLLITVLILAGMIFVSFSSEQISSSKFRLSMTSFWVGRLLGLRSIMMLNSYYFDYYSSAKSFLTFLLILTYLFYEATIGFQRHVALKKSIVSGLQLLGQDPAVVSTHTVTSIPTSASTSEGVTVSKRFSPPFSRESSTETRDSSLQTSSTQNYTSSPVIMQNDSKIRRMGRSSSPIIRSLVSILIMIFTPVFSFIKAFFITIILLLGSLYEVILFLLILLTGVTADGSYIIPTYSFSFQYGVAYQVGGYTIWSWYLLGALAAQIFLLVVIEWFQFVRKKPDGFILIFFRNFSRLLLFGLFLGSVNQNYWGDLYAMPRIIIMIVLFIFMELTSLKIRLEQRKWRNNSILIPLESETDGQEIPNNLNSNNNVERERKRR